MSPARDENGNRIDNRSIEERRACIPMVEAWGKANPEKKKAAAKKLRLQQKALRDADPELKKAYSAHIKAISDPKKRKESDRKKNAKLKKTVFDHYGNSCRCCGENEPFFLAIDHINEDGAKHRKEIAKGTTGINFYRWLIKAGLPVGFQTLCNNCNIGKHRNGGICPHKTTPVAYVSEGSLDRCLSS